MNDKVLGLAVLTLVFACRDTSSPAPEGAAAPAAAVTPAQAASPDQRTQYDLVSSLAEIEKLDDPEAQDPRYEAIVRGYRDRRFHWEVYVPAVMCKRPDACFAVPFDHARKGRIVAGWLPTLALSPASHAALVRGCADKALCVVSFAGRLHELGASSMDATRVGFDEVEVLAMREARADEQWIHSPVKPAPR